MSQGGEYNLTGKKHLIKSPTKDGLDLVRESYPNAMAEGSTNHWTYFIKDYTVIVGESWPHRTKNNWWLIVSNTK